MVAIKVPSERKVLEEDLRKLLPHPMQRKKTFFGIRQTLGKHFLYPAGCGSILPAKRYTLVKKRPGTQLFFSSSFMMPGSSPLVSSSSTSQVSIPSTGVPAAPATRRFPG
ncbi:hypothetical protein AV530_014673 [Patagioenas fasciata monilis]|uniref:Uncharacterized protein n=1 Tax=Patagioenas fasciata monilis TaxID=372326 RepID=A0A1V4KCR2_PATFA|nr:hypothetical protein AV530_014673 [Patagioenas fasciata monilis]